jgi:8-oxo-dGTP diphosphatase
MHRTVAPHGPIDERVDFFFECRRWAGEPRIQEADKSADLRWFDLTALPDPVVPHEHQVMATLRDGSLRAIVTNGFA